jgi:hypothetical protein
MASNVVPNVLALEVTQDGSTAAAEEVERADSRDGSRQSHLGRGTHCGRIEPQARDPRLAARTIRKYLAKERPGGGSSDQRWATFVRNHAKAIVACDFLVSITATFQILYVFVAMEIGSRRILHLNVTAHPTAEWTTQQFREILSDPHPYRFVVHDRDCIFSASLDRALKDFGVRPIRTPILAPKANAYCSGSSGRSGASVWII